MEVQSAEGENICSSLLRLSTLLSRTQKTIYTYPNSDDDSFIFINDVELRVSAIFA